MTLTPKLRQAIVLSKKWFKKTQNRDFGWSRLRSSPSCVNSTSEAINILMALGEDLESPQIRKGFLWLLEKRELWGNEQLKGSNDLVNTSSGLDELCWGLMGLGVSNNTFARKVFSEKLELLLSRQVMKVKEKDDDKYLGLFVEKQLPTQELWGLYTSALALKIMSKHLPKGDERIGKVIDGLRKHTAKDGGWPTRLTMSPDLEPDPCYTAIILDALLCAGESVEKKYISDALKFLESELKERGYLWSELVDEKFRKKDKREQASTEATGQGLITLLEAGYGLDNEAVKKAINWLLSEDVFVWQGEDKGGFRLFPDGPILNYSTYYGALALKTVLDVEEGWKEFIEKYSINEYELDIKTKTFLNRHIIDDKTKVGKPITISRLQECGLLDKTLRGKIRDKETVNRIWCVLKILEKNGPLSLAELGNLVREKSKFLTDKKKSWTREMFIVLSRLNTQNLIVLYKCKHDANIEEVKFPKTEAEYGDLRDAKIWSLFDLGHVTFKNKFTSVKCTH